MNTVDLNAIKTHAQTLTSAQRHQIAESWLNAALDEHASIAAFSRFSLHLMALGAPPTLVRDAHQAALDELNHAELCFSVYEAYAEQPAAPSPLTIPDNILGPMTPESIVGAAVAEGCVGETIAAHEASQLAHLSEPMPIKEVLTQIAQDEQAHAELAWRFVGWALKAFGPSVRKAAITAFADTCVYDHTHHSASSDDGVLSAHGVASPTFRRDLRNAAIDEVILPLKKALLGA